MTLSRLGQLALTLLLVLATLALLVLGVALADPPMSMW